MKIPTRSQITFIVLAVASIGLMLYGTFRPWVQSGTVARNSYQIAGVLRRTEFVPSRTALALVSAWPYLTSLLVVPLLLVVFGLWRTAGFALTIIAVSVGALMAVMLGIFTGRQLAGVFLLSSGPITVLVGAGLAAIAGVGLCFAPRRASHATNGPVAASHSASRSAAVPQPGHRTWQTDAQASDEVQPVPPQHAGGLKQDE